MPPAAQPNRYVYPEALACSVLRQILEETTDRNRFWIWSFGCVFSINSKLQFHTSSGRQPACVRQRQGDLPVRMYIEEVCDERARPRRRQKRQRPATFRLPSHPARPCSNQRRSSRQSASRDYSWIRIIVITSTPSLPPAAAGGAVAASSSSRVPRRRRSCPRAHRRSSTRRRTPPRPRRDGHRRDALPLIAAGSPPDCICRD